jgi:hypothetical protein
VDLCSECSWNRSDDDESSFCIVGFPFVVSETLSSDASLNL